MSAELKAPTSEIVSPALIRVGSTDLLGGTVMRDAIPADLPAIDSLRKKEGDALGFIPIGAYQSVTMKAPVDGRWRHLHSRLVILIDNGDITGFCYASYAGTTAKIFQIVVRQDARRWHRAMMLEGAINADATHYGKEAITCRVAFDLESNFFWRAIGYIPERQVVSTWLNQRESQSKRPLWHYRKELSGGLFHNPPNSKVSDGGGL